jgi:DNA repair photolyase
VCILTKGGMRATADFDLLDSHDIMAASLTCIDDADSLKWEPRAALPEDRFALLRAAKAKGMETWASLEPVIYPDQTLRIIDATRGIVDLYKIGTINYVKAVSDKIDWPAFVRAAMDRVRANGAAYYIKDDLLKFAPAGTAAHWNPHGKAMMHA